MHPRSTKMVSYELNYERTSYLTGPESTNLHTVDVWQSTSEQNVGRLWLIYIHGGAWRDPATDSLGFLPAVKELLQRSVNSEITGFASINYRLSPYPSHPDNPSSPDNSSRNVHHPAHLMDVGQALLYLEDKYQIANRYLLIGHSAGATLAFQLHNSYFPTLKQLPLPAAILGVSGIYHFNTFVESHSGIPAYRELMENAFPDLNQWEEAGPCTSRLAGPAIWEHARQIVIAHSDGDELVEKGQATAMLERIRTVLTRKNVHFLEARGKHDEIWESGTILADLISNTLEYLLAQS